MKPLLPTASPEGQPESRTKNADTGGVSLGEAQPFGVAQPSWTYRVGPLRRVLHSQGTSPSEAQNFSGVSGIGGQPATPILWWRSLLGVQDQVLRQTSLLIRSAIPRWPVPPDAPSHGLAPLISRGGISRGGAWHPQKQSFRRRSARLLRNGGLLWSRRPAIHYTRH